MNARLKSILTVGVSVLLLLTVIPYQEVVYGTYQVTVYGYIHLDDGSTLSELVSHTIYIKNQRTNQEWQMDTDEFYGFYSYVLSSPSEVINGDPLSIKSYWEQGEPDEIVGSTTVTVSVPGNQNIRADPTFMPLENPPDDCVWFSNENAPTITSEPHPDPMMTDISYTVATPYDSISDPIEGDTVTLYADVKNRGDADLIDSSTIKFYDNDNPILFGERAFDSLTVGETRTFWVKWVSTEVGDHDIKAVLQINVVEERVDNNELTETITILTETYDSDTDGLPNIWEEENDIDSDHLNNVGLNPTIPDTDGNSINDDQEDFDGDGLVNIDEYQNPSNGNTDRKTSTDPNDHDSDNDGIPDGAEVNIAARTDTTVTTVYNSYDLGAPPSSVVIRRDGRFAVVADHMNRLSIFSPESSSPMVYHEAGQYVDISDDGQSIATTDGSYLKFYDRTGVLMWDEYISPGTVGSVAISGDGNYIIIDAGNGGQWANRVLLYDSEGNLQWSTSILSDYSGQNSINYDGSSIVLGSIGDTYLLSADCGGIPIHQYNTFSDHTNTDTAVTSNGEFIVFAGTGDLTSNPNMVYLAGHTSDQILGFYSLGGHVSVDDGIDISDDGQYIVIGANDEKIYLFKKDIPYELWSFTTSGGAGHENNPIVSITGDGEYIIGAADNNIYYFSKDNNIPICTWQLPPTEYITGLAFSKDGNSIIAITGNNNVYFLEPPESDEETHPDVVIIYGRASDEYVYLDIPVDDYATEFVSSATMDLEGDFNSYIEELTSASNTGFDLNSKASAVYRDELYLMWVENTPIVPAGFEDDIVYRTHDGESLSDVHQVDPSSVNTMAMNPDMIVYDNKLYVIWATTDESITTGPDLDIVFTGYDGYNWDPITELSAPDDTGVDDNPKLMVYNNKLWAFWKTDDTTISTGSDLDIVYRIFDGDTWGSTRELSSDTDTGFEDVMELTVYNGELWAVWSAQGESSDGSDYDIVMKIYDGSAWTSSTEITTTGDTGTDILNDLFVFKGRLFVIWQTDDPTATPDTNFDIVYKSYDGVNWGSIVEISSESDNGEDTFARAIVFNNKMYVAWVTNDDTISDGTDMDIVIRSFNGENWNRIYEILSPSNSEIDLNPNLMAFDQKMFASWETDDPTITTDPDIDIALEVMSSYPTNPSISVRDVEFYEWSFSDEFTVLDTTSDFANSLNIYLNSHEDIDDGTEDGHIFIPINVHSDSSGKILISNVDVQVDIVETDPTHADSDGDGINDGEELDVSDSLFRTVNALSEDGNSYNLLKLEYTAEGDKTLYAELPVHETGTEYFTSATLHLYGETSGAMTSFLDVGNDGIKEWEVNADGFDETTLDFSDALNKWKFSHEFASGQVQVPIVLHSRGDVTISNINFESEIFTTNPAIANGNFVWDSYGNRHLVWQQPVGYLGMVGVLYASSIDNPELIGWKLFNPYSTSLTNVDVLHLTMAEVVGPQIAVDSSDDLHVAWKQIGPENGPRGTVGGDHNLNYFEYSGGDWSRIDAILATYELDPSPPEFSHDNINDFLNLVSDPPVGFNPILIDFIIWILDELLALIGNPPTPGQDSDGDGLLDSEEDRNQNDIFEPELLETDENDKDTDDDMLWDGPTQVIGSVTYWGENTHGTDPLDPDTDGDELIDGIEVYGWNIPDDSSTSYHVTSSPNEDNTDPDSDDPINFYVTDYYEWAYLSNPWDGNSDGDEDPGNPGTPYLRDYDEIAGWPIQVDYQFVNAFSHPSLLDSDDDIYSDVEEYDGIIPGAYQTHPFSTDTDDDGLNDEEYNDYGTVPILSDTDEDSVDGCTNDGREVEYISQFDPNPETYSSDGDLIPDILDYNSDNPDVETSQDQVPSGSESLSDGQEMYTHRYADKNHADPKTQDSDGDGLLDDEEIQLHRTDVNNVDTDGDGIDDDVELGSSTNPLDPDSDDDGLSDGQEDINHDGVYDHSFPDTIFPDPSLSGDKPISIRRAVIDSESADRKLLSLVSLDSISNFDKEPNPTQPDTDHDGMLDGWEAYYGLDIFNIIEDDSVVDSDTDSLLNEQEHHFNTHPRSSNSDEDTISDYDEARIVFRTNAPFDSDGILEYDNVGTEIGVDTDPFDEVLDTPLSIYYNPTEDTTKTLEDLLDNGAVFIGYTPEHYSIYLYSDDVYIYNTESFFVFDLGGSLDDSRNPSATFVGKEVPVDTDNDGLINALDTDSDNDKIPDIFESAHTVLDPYNSDDALQDSDNDGLTNLNEYKLGTNMYIGSYDDDGDGFIDEDPIDGVNDDNDYYFNDGTSPVEGFQQGDDEIYVDDGDNDDYIDNYGMGFDTCLYDGGDGSRDADDGKRIVTEKDGLTYGHWLIDEDSDGFDTDIDGLPDGWEVYYGLNPNTYNDPLSDDPDEDGIYSYDEYIYHRPTGWPSDQVWWGGTDPTSSDTDSDGTGNNEDIDDDDDGVVDYDDAFPLDASEWKDSDNDGTGDNADNDDDNDGILDNDEKYYVGPIHIGLFILIIILVLVAILIFTVVRRKKAKVNNLSLEKSSSMNLIHQKQLINCPSCGYRFEVAEKKRPLRVQCPHCGTNGTLYK